MAVDNLRAQLQMNEAIRQRSRMLQTQTQEMRTQVELALQLAAIQQSDSVDEMVDKLEELREALEEAREEIDDLDESQSGMFKSMIANAKSAAAAVAGLAGTIIKGVFSAGAAVVGFVGGAISSLVKGLAAVIEGGLKFGTKVIRTIITGLWELSKAIIAVPFKMFTAFIEAASELQVYEEMIRAIEKVRGAFGSLKQTLGTDVIRSFKNVQSNVKGATLGAGAAFGFAHERLEFFMEKEKEMGSVFEVMSDVIRDNATEFGWLIKGMDLTGEMMKSVGERAITFGRTIIEVGEDVNNMAQQMVADGFAKSAKTVSKAMVQMMHDVSSFGTLTIREIGVSVVYFKNLGVEIEKIIGLVDGFDNFDDAAKRVSQLSQAFGVQVDVVKMMEAQNPAERADMLRKSFFATGQTVENMTRQEQKLLASTMNLDVATSNLLFSRKNMGRSYDSLTRQAKAAEKSPMKQAKAMQNLADAIERIIHILDPHKGGIFENFFKGFAEGVMGKEFRFFTPALRKQMKQIRQILVDVRMLGVRVGALFVKFFPPMVKFREAVEEMFDSGRWAKALKTIEGLFEAFFKDPPNQMGNLIKGLGKVIRELFPVEVIDAFKGMFRSLGMMIAKMGAKLFDYFLQGLTWVLEKLVVFLRTPGNFAAKLAAAASQGIDGARAEISPMFQPFIDAWNNNADALGKAAGTLWNDIIKPRAIAAFNAIVDWLKTEGVQLLGKAKEYFIAAGKEFIDWLIKGWHESSFSLSDIIGSSTYEMIKSGMLIAGGLLMGGPLGLGPALAGAIALAFENATDEFIQDAVDKSNRYVHRIADAMKSTAMDRAAQDTASDILKAAYGVGLDAVTDLDDLTGRYNSAQQRLVAARADVKLHEGTMFESTSRMLLASAEKAHQDVMAELEFIKQHTDEYQTKSMLEARRLITTVHSSVSNKVDAAVAIGDKLLQKGKGALQGLLGRATDELGKATSIWKSFAGPSKPAGPKKPSKPTASKAIKTPVERLMESHSSTDLWSAKETIGMARYIIRNARLVDRAIAKAEKLSERAKRSGGFSTTISTNIANISQEISRISGQLGQTVRDAQGAVTESAGARATVGAITSNVTGMITDVSGVTKAFESAVREIGRANKRAEGSSRYSVAAVNHIQDMIKEVNTVADELDSIKAVNLVPTLQRFANTIQGGGKFTINNKKFSIDISLQVKIDGKSIAAAIARPLSQTKFKITEKDDEVEFVTAPPAVPSGPVGEL